MATKEELVTSLIKEEEDEKEQQNNVVVQEEVIEDEDSNKVDSTSNENGQEYVYWARRGENELETAGEVEVSSTGTEGGVPEEGGELLIVEEAIQDNTPPERDPNDLVYGLQVAAEQITAAHQIQNGREEGYAHFSEEYIEQQKRLHAKREAAKLQEKLMNEEYQKAIGYLLCSSKSKSGKQKKKQTMTAYLFFCRRYRAKIVARNPKLSFAQISKLLSHMWRNASEQEKNTYRLKLEQHRTKVNAIVEKNMIEKMKLVKQQKLMEEIQRRNDEESGLVATSTAELQMTAEESQQLHHQHQIADEPDENENATAVAEMIQHSSEDSIAHAVIDPATKTMLLEAEC